MSSFLWVSADPGCGKSVLSRYLVDEELRRPGEEPRGQHARTICYFFFKDGFDDQKFATTALCCILRQLFRQRPECFSDTILTKLEEDKKSVQGNREPPASFHDLWNIFIAAVTGYPGGEIVCVIDALDECAKMGRNHLIDAVVEFYLNNTTHAPAVKFLLTSRPYLEIHERFEDLEREIPTIHLSGESEEQVREITLEIDLVIRSRIEGMRRLGQKEKVVLLEELTKVENRTYLWVHLVFDQIEESSLLSRGRIQSTVNKIPQTVDEAYERILTNSRDPGLARKLLHIVLAAKRPLTMPEMAVALAIGPAHESWDDFELDLVSEDKFHQDVREICGLFVVQVDEEISEIKKKMKDQSKSSTPAPSSITPSLT
ncbi:hypothetical protein IMZ48_00465 [Candidatus Bathyarchaeota archaeon]|nr:hypothetical protein [Candidatus Bathyarchaeota archaeon]